MRNFIYMIVALLAITVQVHAQRCLSGQRGLQLTGGFVDGIYKTNNPNGYYFGATMATYTKGGNHWVFGAEYLNKEYEYKNIYIAKSQFTAEGGYYYNFLSDGSKTFFLSIGGSALAGYETSNWDEKLLYDGSTIKNKDAFLYGGAITLETETYLSDRIVFLINARERILWESTVSKFHTQFGVGLKFIIN